MTPGRPASIDEAHRRPEGVSDAELSAADGMNQALEHVERARGHLYEFHHLIGRANELFTESADDLENCGHRELADQVRHLMTGLNVTHGQWTFQLVEEFDDGFWAAARRAERTVRDDLLDGRRHVAEGELKARDRTPGRDGHRATPTSED